jgi:hypothetical protein
MTTSKTRTMKETPMSDDPKLRPAVQGALPVQWVHKGQVVHKTTTSVSPLHQPTPDEIASFSSQRVDTCASCRHFRGVEKDRPAINGFVALALLEAKWKKAFLGDDPDKLSRCGENSELVVGPNSRACGHYTPRK